MQRSILGAVTIVISMPVYQTEQRLVTEALDSLRHQTRRPDKVVVVLDGYDHLGWKYWSPWVDRDVVSHVIVLPEQRGRFFADHVVLDAYEADLFGVQDSDDISLPRRLELLSKTIELKKLHHCRGNVERRTTFNLMGLYRRDYARWHRWYWGMPYATDTLLTMIHKAFGNGAVLKQTVYRWRKRPGSLSQSKETGVRSAARQPIAEKGRRIWRAVRRAKSLAELRAITRDLWPREVSKEHREQLTSAVDQAKTGETYVEVRW